MSPTLDFRKKNRLQTLNRKAAGLYSKSAKFQNVQLGHQDPATLLANLHLVPECNYWKGLLEARSVQIIRLQLNNWGKHFPQIV